MIKGVDLNQSHATRNPKWTENEPKTDISRQKERRKKKRKLKNPNSSRFCWWRLAPISVGERETEAATPTILGFSLFEWTYGWNIYTYIWYYDAEALATCLVQVGSRGGSDTSSPLSTFPLFLFGGKRTKNSNNRHGWQKQKQKPFGPSNTPRSFECARGPLPPPDGASCRSFVQCVTHIDYHPCAKNDALIAARGSSGGGGGGGGEKRKGKVGVVESNAAHTQSSPPRTWGLCESTPMFANTLFFGPLKKIDVTVSALVISHYLLRLPSG